MSGACYCRSKSHIDQDTHAYLLVWIPKLSYQTWMWLITGGFCSDLCHHCDVSNKQRDRALTSGGVTCTGCNSDSRSGDTEIMLCGHFPSSQPAEPSTKSSSYPITAMSFLTLPHQLSLCSLWCLLSGQPSIFKE